MSEGGRRLLERLEALEKGEDVPPIHTSVAVFLERSEASEEQQAQGAEWIAKIHGMDHDAILLDQVGAATRRVVAGLTDECGVATDVADGGIELPERDREAHGRRIPDRGPVPIVHR